MEVITYFQLYREVYTLLTHVQINSEDKHVCVMTLRPDRGVTGLKWRMCTAARMQGEKARLLW